GGERVVIAGRDDFRLGPLVVAERDAAVPGDGAVPPADGGPDREAVVAAVRHAVDGRVALVVAGGGDDQYAVLLGDVVADHVERGAVGVVDEVADGDVDDLRALGRGPEGAVADARLVVVVDLGVDELRGR